ncbi:hypothetical protein HMPREF1404_00409 [Helicobacter pylori GAM210Bi]|nr:hypothetical protein HMPREF1404_00409 [Helicobacter pylori GAM210Bi]
MRVLNEITHAFTCQSCKIMTMKSKKCGHYPLFHSAGKNA